MKNDTNPFVETGGDLLTLTGTEIAPASTSQSISSLKGMKNEKPHTVFERLVRNITALADPIKRNNVTPFSGAKGRKRSCLKRGILKSNSLTVSSLQDCMLHVKPVLGACT